MTLRNAIRNKRSSLARRKDKKVFFIEKIKSPHEGDDFKIEINGEKFPTLKAAAERFRILPSTINNAIRRGNSFIVRREDKKILEISYLSKRKFKTRICVRSQNKQYWFFTRNKIEEFFNIDIRDIPREDGRFRVNGEKFEIFYPDLTTTTKEEFEDWSQGCRDELFE